MIPCFFTFPYKVGYFHLVDTCEHFNQLNFSTFLSLLSFCDLFAYTPIVVVTHTHNTSSYRFGPVCPQRLPNISNETAALEKMPKGRLEYLRRLLPYLQNQSEDCLYLNIYVPIQGECYRLVYIDFNWILLLLLVNFFVPDLLIRHLLCLRDG